MTTREASALARAILERLQDRGHGAVAMVDFLDAPLALDTCAQVRQLLPGWDAVVVNGDGPMGAGEDDVVALREDLERRLLVFLPVGTEAAGLQGVRSTAEVLPAASIYRTARAHLLRDMKESSAERAAVCREVLQHYSRRALAGSSKASRERTAFHFLAEALESGPGPALPRLGWLPDAGDEASLPQRIDRNEELSRRLLPRFGSESGALRERVAGLQLADQRHASSLLRFLEGLGPRLDAIEEWGQEILEQGLGFEGWEFEAVTVRKIQIQPFRNGKTGKALKWTGLESGGMGGNGEGRLELRVPPEGPEGENDKRRAKKRLTIRWKVEPRSIPRGQAIYEIALMPSGGAEPFYSMRHEHACGKNYEQVRIPLTDLLDDWDEQPMELALRITVDPDGTRQPEEKAGPEDSFWLVPDEVREDMEASGRAEVVRSLGEVRIWARANRLDDAPPSPFESRKKGTLAWGLRLKHREAVLRRPGVLAMAEKQLLESRPGGHLPFGKIMVDRAGRAGDPSTCRERQDSALDEILSLRRRVLAELMEDGSHPPLCDYARESAQRRILDYESEWTRLLSGGAPPEQAWRIDTYEIRDVDKQILCVMLSPFHPLRLLWFLGYQLFCDKLLEQESRRLNWKKSRTALERLDGRNFPPVLPALVLPDARSPFVCAGIVEAAWGIYLPMTQQHPGETLDRVRWALGIEKWDERESETRNWLTQRVEDFFGTGLARHRLVVSSHASGDGALLDEVLHGAMENLENLDKKPMVRVNFLHHGTHHGDTFFDRAARRDEGTVSRLMGQELDAPTSAFRPALEWRTASTGEPVQDAHLAFVGDLFASSPTCREDPGSPGDALLHGLVLPTSLEWLHGTGGWLRWWRPWHGEKQEHLGSYTRRMQRLLMAWLRRSADSFMDEDEDEHASEPGRERWPAQKVEVHGPPRQLLDELHDRADWIFLLDRRATADLYALPTGEGEPLGTIIEVHGSPGTDLGGAMVISRAHEPLLVERISRELAKRRISRRESVARGVIEALSRLGGQFQVRALRGGEEAIRAVAAAATSQLQEFSAGFLLAAEAVEIPEPGARPICDILHVSLQQRTLHLRPVLVGIPQDERDPRVELERAFGLEEDVLGTPLGRLQALPLVRSLLSIVSSRHKQGRMATRMRRAISALLALPGEAETLRVQVDDPWIVEWTGEDEPTPYMDAMWTIDGISNETVSNLAQDLRRSSSGLKEPDDELDPEEVPPLLAVIGDQQPQPRPLEGQRGDAAMEGELGPVATRPGTLVGVFPNVGSGVAESPQNPAPGDPREIHFQLGERSGQPFSWTLTPRGGSPHALVVGRTGTGKTTLLVNLVHQAAEAGCGVLVIGFHSDLREQVSAAVGAHRVLIVEAAADGVPLDPLSVEPSSEKRIMRRREQDRAQAVAETWATVFNGLGDAQKGMLEKAARQLFARAREAGHQGSVDFSAFPGALKQVLRNARTASERNLLARVRRFDGIFSPGEALAMERLVGQTTVLDASGFESEDVVRGIACFVLEHVYRRMRSLGQSAGMRLLVFLDEAHLAARLKTLARIAREGRKYGVGIFLASQGEADFNPDVYKNTGLQVILQVDANEAKIITRHWTGSAKEARRYQRLISKLQRYEAIAYRTGESPVRFRCLPPSWSAP